MRGADGGPWQRICALSALWVGLLYEEAALDAASSLVKDWTAEERQALRTGVPRTALATPFRATSVARRGLWARRRINRASQDESIYLNPLDEVVASGRTLADELIARYQGPWRGDIDHVFEEYAF
jgi:glutamate--cysteine ligase